MTPAVLILDVYKTILRVEPPVTDTGALWTQLWRECLGGEAPFGLAEFGHRCKAVIEARHAVARARGVDYPEIVWEDVVAEIIPETAHLPAERFDRFIEGQARTWHLTSLDEGCVPVLREARQRKLKLGIASNAQRYTHWELSRCLAQADMGRDLFDPQLCFWSFENGFSKPSERVFRFLGAQALRMGYGPGEIMMIGDRVDNDIEPALAQGWQVWHLRESGGSLRHLGGSWEDLHRHLFSGRG